MSAREPARASRFGRSIVGKRLAALALAALACAGCSYMRFHRPPEAGIVKCGTVPVPFWYWLEPAQEKVYEEATCIEQRHAEGYAVALPEPYFFFIPAGSLYTGHPSYTKMP
jgi:hypothetical protein